MGTASIVMPNRMYSLQANNYFTKSLMPASIFNSTTRR